VKQLQITDLLLFFVFFALRGTTASVVAALATLFDSAQLNVGVAVTFFFSSGLVQGWCCNAPACGVDHLSFVGCCCDWMELLLPTLQL
jgi:hypothetical protein